MTREKAIEWFEFQKKGFVNTEYEEYLNLAITALSVQNVPSVENKGEWIAQDIHNCCTVFKCSKCGYEHNFLHLYGKPTADYPYCPNCGSDMRGET